MTPSYFSLLVALAIDLREGRLKGNAQRRRRNGRGGQDAVRLRSGRATIQAISEKQEPGMRLTLLI